MPTILLNTGTEVQIDYEDIYLLSYLWYEKNSRGKKYAYNNQLGFMHKHILKPRPGYHTSHEDGDTFNNRRRNLKERTPSGNGRNRAGACRNSSTGLLGVYPRKNGKFQAAIKAERNGPLVWLGTFNTAEEAHQARLAAERKYWGVMPQREHLHG